ncbi:hypothetical protein LX32DRAFT_641865 [Colletotrichum zoysiae]|uniref:Uncharacterized protein n=1 Tax=Colletotrichum zoysiae TaxID=1216348 RepID=A0AAD9LZB7_9PEZI|nr:hypothetical protein LX32DRAFT_641865 [Colletotrichum zoysiae]
MVFAAAYFRRTRVTLYFSLASPLSIPLLFEKKPKRAVDNKTVQNPKYSREMHRSSGLDMLKLRVSLDASDGVCSGCATPLCRLWQNTSSFLTGPEKGKSYSERRFMKRFCREVGAC